MGLILWAGPHGGSVQELGRTIGEGKARSASGRCGSAGTLPASFRPATVGPAMGDQRTPLRFAASQCPDAEAGREGEPHPGRMPQPVAPNRTPIRQQHGKPGASEKHPAFADVRRREGNLVQEAGGRHDRVELQALVEAVRAAPSPSTAPHPRPQAGGIHRPNLGGFYLPAQPPAKQNKPGCQARSRRLQVATEVTDRRPAACTSARFGRGRRTT